MEETLHCDNKGKPKECSILQHSVSQSESYYEVRFQVGLDQQKFDQQD